VYNGTGSTIFNGTAVHPVGAVAGRPSVAVAAADTFTTFRGVVLITTMDIPTDTVGIVSQDGKVRGVDTSGFDLGNGNVIWLSNDGDGILNNITNIRPSFPSYAIQIGGIAVQDAADGVLQLEIVGKAIDTTQNFWNGTFREPFDFRVTEDGGTVTGTLTPTNGHPDMTMIFSDGFTMLDTDPGATIDLTSEVGTDTAPITVYVYIPQSTKVLTLADSVTGWPKDVEHIRVAQLVLQSAATTGTSGALRNQNYNDEIQNTNTNQGHLSHIGQRIRAMYAVWDLGAEATLTVADTANSYVSVTSGHVFQMHDQTYPALSMPTDNMEVVNDPDTAYNPITTLNDITKTSDGTPIPNNRWISVVIWGVANKSGETSHMLCNVPSGTYTSEAAAQTDALSYSNFTIPLAFRGVGFLIARFTIQRKTSTINYLGGSSYQDLRGFIPNSTAGSGAGGSGVTTFAALTDTPASYVGEGLKLARVNVGETALEFVSPHDHSVYLLLDGTRAMTGDLDMGTQDITESADIIPAADDLYDLGVEVELPGGGFELKDTQSANDTSAYVLSTAFSIGQTFTPTEDYSIGKVTVKLSRTPSGTRDCTLSIRATSAGLPTGGNLVSKNLDISGITTVDTGELVDFEFDTPLALTDGVMYAIVLNIGTTGVKARYGSQNYTVGTMYASTSVFSTFDLVFYCYKTVASIEFFRWANLYLAGSLKDGTNEVSIAEIYNSLTSSVRTEIADYEVVAGDNTVLVDTNSEAVTITLPAIPTQARTIVVKCIDATNTCTVARNGNNIDGAASDQTLLLNESLTLQYDSIFGWAII
jgi:hypothetical protein